MPPTAISDGARDSTQSLDVGNPLNTAHMHRGRPSDPSGVPFMIFGSLFGAGVVVVAKALGDTYPVLQLMWFRYVIHVAIVVLAFGPRLRTKLVATGLLRIQLLRSTLIVLTTALFFLAVRFLPVAETTAIVYLAPLITVLLAGPILSERASPRTAWAAAAGFAGVIAVIQPFSGAFGVAVLLPLGAAVTSSFYLMMTRLIGWRDSAPTTLFYTGSVGLIASSVAIPFLWVRPVSRTDLALLISLGVFGGVGHFLYIKAHQRSLASGLAPLSYLELGFVTVMGLMFFDDFPNLLSSSGMVLIAAAGIVVANQRRSRDTHTVRV